MIKIFNGVFGILKFLLLLISFMLTFYIVMLMYDRLDKNLFDSIWIFIPYGLLMILYTINIILNQKNVTRNIFYNITSCLVFSVLIFVSYRALKDDYLLSTIKMGYGVNFNYFADILAPLKSMIYLLSVSNVLLMLSNEKEVKEKKVRKVKKISLKEDEPIIIE